MIRGMREAACDDSFSHRSCVSLLNLRERKTIKPQATIYCAKQATKKTIGRLTIRFE